MKNNIYKSLSDYKSNYTSELEKFKSIHTGASEIYFIDEQLRLYQVCINNTKILYRKDGSVYTVSSIQNETEQIKSVLDEFMDSDGNRFDKDICTSLFYTFKSIAEYLIEKKENYLSRIKEESNTPKTNAASLTNFKININQTELIELVKALIENNNIKGVQKDIIVEFEKFFNMEIKNPNKLLNDIKNRNNGSETLFLNSLKLSLLNYITKEKRR